MEIPYKTETLFEQFKPPLFGRDPNAIPQESLIGQGEIQPTGWVMNSTADVIVDEEGIHIRNGAIFLEDEFGESVLGASGFAGSWSRFISSGLYNSDFKAGTIASVPISIVTGSDLPSASLPYWVGYYVTSYTSANWEILHQTDLSADSDKSVRVRTVNTHSNGEEVGVYQREVPVQSGVRYGIFASLKWSASDPTNKPVKVNGRVAYYDASGTFISSDTNGITLTGTSTAAWTRVQCIAATAPDGATIAKVAVGYMTTRSVDGAVAGDYLDINYISWEGGAGDADWGVPTLLNSWTNYNTATFNAAGYFKDSQGFVHLRGLVKDGTTGAIFTLPAGYRPARQCIFNVLAGEGAGEASRRVDVQTSGAVLAGALVTNNDYLSLEGITFYVGV